MMGLDRNSARFLMYAKSLGADFSESAMIGRQTLNLSQKDFCRNLSDFGFHLDPHSVKTVFNEHKGYAETFLEFLGARTTDSIDYSDYEGATHVHDMNLPISDAQKSRYTAVIDSGSLEHVFNFPVALRNCMELLKPGGYYLGITPANNFMGHGFYQFSPELFFRVFCQKNGFRLAAMIVAEDSSSAPWYEVRDPAEVGNRVTLKNDVPTYLLVAAQRIAEHPVLLRAPQQSDYVACWERAETDSQPARSATSRRMISALKKRIPRHWKAKILRLANANGGRYPKKYYRPLALPNGRNQEKRVLQRAA